MQRTQKFLTSLAFLAVLLTFPFSLFSCNNSEDNSGTDENEVVNDVAENIDDVAFNIIRELCNLDSEPEDDEPDVESLPSDWKSKTFTPDAGEPLLKSETKTYTLPYPDPESQTGYSNIRVTWTYAKEVMSLKTAKTAYHTFNIIANPILYQNIDYCRSVDVAALKDSNRNKRITEKTGANSDFAPFSRLAGVAYIQPYLSGTTEVINEIHLEESLLTFHSHFNRRLAHLPSIKTYLSPTDVFA